MEKSVNPSLLDEAVDSLMESDEYYQKQSTLLKSADQLKEQARQEIRKNLEASEFQKVMVHGLQLIITKIPDENLFEEFKNYKNFAQAHLEELEKAASERLVVNQEIFGISEASMEKIYSLGTQLIGEVAYADAEAVFTVLCFLNPAVTAYFVGLAVACFSQGKYQECLICLEIPKILEPENISLHIYSALSKIKLEDTATLKEDVALLDTLFTKYPDEKKDWKDVYSVIQQAAA